MMKPTWEQDFCQRCNDIDEEDSGNWIGLAIIFALSGFTVGFVFGCLLDRFLAWL